MEERKPPEGERIRGLDVPITRNEWDKGGERKKECREGLSPREWSLIQVGHLFC